ncbi:MAG: type II toxin-antitoxin system VapC family toxin [Burkholderiales bacterium]
MITAIDTSVLLDVFGADARFGEASARALRHCLAEGAIVACEVVWVEAGAAFSSAAVFEEAMKTLGVGFSSVNELTVRAAAKAWRGYRTRGGKRERVVADFLVGAHAMEQCDRLLSRDRGFYRECFNGLKLLDPSRG